MASSSPLRVIMVTAPPKKAEGLARALLEERLVACVNLIPVGHVLGGVLVVIQPGQSEAVEAGKVPVEELVERALVAGEHPAREAAVPTVHSSLPRSKPGSFLALEGPQRPDPSRTVKTPRERSGMA